MLLQRVRAQGREVEVDWRYFSLTQINNKVEGWTVWGAPADEEVRGRLAFQAAEAARRQDAFDRLHLPLLEARHVEHRELSEREVVLDVAANAGLDRKRFERDLDDPHILDALARDHERAVAEHGVFGTPTFVFPDGAAAYVRVRPAPEGEAAPAVFDELTRLIAARPFVLEVKRPTRPES